MIKTELVADNVFYKCKKGNDSIYVVVDAPRVREISYECSMVNSEYDVTKIKGSCKLDLPYICYIVKFHKNKFAGLQMFFSTRKIQDVDQPSLDSFEFLNCDNSRVCLGGKAVKFLKKKSVNDVLRLLPRIFWETPFNDADAELDEIFSKRLTSGKLNKRQIVNNSYTRDEINDVSINEIIIDHAKIDIDY